MQKNIFPKIILILALLSLGVAARPVWQVARAAVTAGTFNFTENYNYTSSGIQIYAGVDSGGAAGNLGAVVIKGGIATYSVLLTNMNGSATPTNIRVRLPAGYQYVSQVSGLASPSVNGSTLQWPAYPVPAGESSIVINVRAQ